MTDPQALGALARIHELQLQLVETLPPRDCNRRFEPELPSAGWLLGRAVYLELHLLRNRVRDDSTRIEQGHYRIGARGGAVLCNEQPAQLVELHAFRISRTPVRNAEFLAFMQDGGYRDADWWDDDGRRWLAAAKVAAPWHWQTDQNGHWYTIGTNGPMDLHADDVVSGLSAHEARAYAAWAAARGEGLAGAVPQHEYQWEVAARLGELERQGRCWDMVRQPLPPLPRLSGASGPATGALPHRPRGHHPAWWLPAYPGGAAPHDLSDHGTTRGAQPLRRHPPGDAARQGRLGIAASAGGVQQLDLERQGLIGSNVRAGATLPIGQGAGDKYLPTIADAHPRNRLTESRDHA